MTQQVGKYQLVRKLATGGMAEVFLAKAAGPMGFEKTLVLKRILPHLAEEPAFVEMFLGEAMLAARLTHPHIAQIFDFGESEGSYFLAMEYVDGPSLRTLIKRAASLGLTLPPALCARLVSHACEGLAFAHDFADPETGEPMGLIHRDISPDNILLSRQGAVKVVDFGIAKAAGQSHKTRSGVIKGKLAYMPPEQLRARQMDRRVDVYALGVVLYELLTGQRPYTSDSDAGLMQAILFEPPLPAARARPDLPESMRHILDRALAKEPDQRYPDCHSLQSDLEDFILSVGKPVTTQQVAQLIQAISTGNPVLPVAAATPAPRPEAPVLVKNPGPSAPVGSAQTAQRQDTRGASEESLRTLVTPPPHEPPPAPVPTTQVQAGPLAASKRPEEPEEPQPTRVDPLGSATPANRWRLALVTAVVLLAGGGATLWGMNSGPEVQRSEPPTGRTPEVAVAPPPEPSAAPAPLITDAGAVAEAVEPTPPPAEPAAAQDAGVALAPAPPTSPPVREPARPKRPVPSVPKVVLKGMLELRIRPYATVFVDGMKVGDTPIEPLELPVGRHTVKLVYTTLSKTETLSVSIQAEQTVTIKRNLMKQ